MYGQLVVGEQGDLMVEFEDKNAADDLSKALSKQLGIRCFFRLRKEA